MTTYLMAMVMFAAYVTISEIFAVAMIWPRLRVTTPIESRHVHGFIFDGKSTFAICHCWPGIRTQNMHDLHVYLYNGSMVKCKYANRKPTKDFLFVGNSFIIGYRLRGNHVSTSQICSIRTFYLHRVGQGHALKRCRLRRWMTFCKIYQCL